MCNLKYSFCPRAEGWSESGHYFELPLANNMGYNCFGVITRLRKLLNQFAIPSQIIIGSKPVILNVTKWFEAGTYIVTISPSLLKSMIPHLYAKESGQIFLRDAAKVNEIAR